MRTLIALYSHPEAYPPTLNAIEACARKSEKVIVFCRQLLKSHWKYPDNVEVNFATEYIDVFQVERISYWRKLAGFLKYTRGIASAIRNKKIELIIAYDPIPLLACFLARLLSRRHSVLWYHSHDVAGFDRLRRFSLGWFAAGLEPHLFRYIGVFTLPAKERERFFPLHSFQGQHFVIPNFPPAHLFCSSKVTVVGPPKEIKLLYQGSLGPHHGFEELIPMLDTRISGCSLKLTLMGKIRANYGRELFELARMHGVEEHFEICGFIPYGEVPAHLAEFDIGLAIHKPVGITYSTGGTASNKIYEYAAVGLPVILYDSPHYRQYLERFEWTVFTDLTDSSMKGCIEAILQHYEMMSKAAKNDFLSYLNFENVFIPVLNQVIKRDLQDF